MFGDYDKFYQNVFANARARHRARRPERVTLAAYNNVNNRRNLFSQTDLIWENRLGGIDQTLLFGFEVGRAEIAQLPADRHHFAAATPTSVPLTDPTVVDDCHLRADPERRQQPHARRPSPRSISRTRSAQRRWLEIVAGLRFDSFKLDGRRPAAGARRRVQPPRQPVVAAARPDPQAGRQSVDLHQLQPLVSAAIGRPVQRARRRHRSAEARALRQF